MGLRWILAGMIMVWAAPAAPAGAHERVIAQAPSKRVKAKEQKSAGDRFMKAGKRKRAEAAYRRACEVDPDWYEAHEALGNLLFSSKRYMDAVEAFKKAIKAEPRYATGFYNIAFAYRKARKYPQAAEYYRLYIQRKQDDPDAYYGLAATYEAMGKDREAMEYYLEYSKKETRPSERQYVVKAKNKAEKLREALGLAPKPKPKPRPAPATKPAPVVKPATATTTATATPTATRPVARPAARPSPTPTPAPKPAPAPAPVPKPAPKPKPVMDTGAKIAMLLAEGDKAMREKSYTRAMKAYFDAVKLDSRHTDALYKLGLVYQATGSTKAAKVKWRNVLAIDPNHRKAKQALALAEKPAPAPAPKPPARPTVAPKPAPVVAKPAPPPKPAPKPKPAPRVATASKKPSKRERVEQLVKQGDSHFKQKSFSRAIASYTHATQLDPRHEEALFKLGVAYAMSGNYKVAVFKWKQVLKINPHNKSALRNIQRAEGKLGPGGSSAKITSAPSRAGRPTVVKKTDFESLMALARQYKKKGKARKVLKTVNKALKVKQDAQAFMLKGESLVFLRRYGEAKRAFSRTMVLDPNLAAPFYGLGEACRLSGDKKRARYYFQMYVKSNAPDVRPALVNRAKAFLKK